MGIGGISVGSLLLILVIVMLVFGTRKLRNVGGDLGGALKSFRSAMKDGAEGADEVRTDLSLEEGATRPVQAEASQERKSA
ncbi:MAG: twin-arginine translocase TatA/TatE family subunit [Aquisalimonadaceae bacterium]